MAARADRLAVVLLTLAIALAGCSALPVEGGEDAPTPSEGVRVTEVVDGDTVDVRFPDGSTDRVRLVGVDTPEVHVAVDPSDFPGVPNSSAGRACLREAGHDASAFTAAWIRDGTVTLEYDPNTDRRGGFDRLLAYVVRGNESLNYALVESGHATVYPTDFAERDRYERAVESAREDGIGVWRCATDGRIVADGGTTPIASGLRLVTITADAPGDDRENLNGEVVVFENAGEEALALEGWTVTDEADHRYTFGDLSLAPGDRVALHTGSGSTHTSDGVTHVYWGESAPVWNNDGDTVTVRDANRAVVLSHGY